MISMIFSYILLGVSLSAPVGPINVAQINKGIKNGFWSAWLVGVGAMSADIIMMLLIYFGVSTYLTTPIAQLCIWIFGFVTMLYLGYESIKDAPKQVQHSLTGEKEHPFKSFLSGFAIAISNPLNIVFWIGIYGSVLTNAINTIGKEQALWYSTAIFAGIMLWDLFMATSIHLGRRFVNRVVMKWISISAGIILIGFGIYFGYQAVLEIKHLL
ncbi:lysine transporter LysE [Bacillus pseudomycoides]|uniref:Lysine transporter LysE n=1 Tax=Bacillus pseudomycoides TaxID=64104 RepID=A0A2C0VJ69_9BACI|nr:MULTISPECIES: LysE family transporter [Bacillus cereus group]MBD5798815.1 lysine transporter LysE [Bacillus pseudomycoides]MBJ8031857.1 LysE family transporter [Bacillus cereus group sp. N21]MCR8861006.1 LysE family translocator [Bacillus pseudomycoides]MDR4329791.1 lysine transporter LysE [Bacillus pseudomycoides]MED1478425.1 LysE family transporter [Bacillus pseudomycoides]